MKTRLNTKYNFHKHTFCVFKEVDSNAIQNLKINYSSKSGSSYYFTDEGLYRVSNHWGRAANCRWKLELISSQKSNKMDANLKQVQLKVGYAKWTDFYPNNEQENLFYVQVNFENKTVDFQHKNNPNYDEKSICRNASDTAKRIKICKEVLLEDNWFKYLIYNSLKELRHKVINELLTTNNSFIDIKRNYLK